MLVKTHNNYKTTGISTLGQKEVGMSGRPPLVGPVFPSPRTDAYYPPYSAAASALLPTQQNEVITAEVTTVGNVLHCICI